MLQYPILVGFKLLLVLCDLLRILLLVNLGKFLLVDQAKGVWIVGAVAETFKKGVSILDGLGFRRHREQRGRRIVVFIAHEGRVLLTKSAHVQDFDVDFFAHLRSRTHLLLQQTRWCQFFTRAISKTAPAPTRTITSLTSSILRTLVLLIFLVKRERLGLFPRLNALVSAFPSVALNAVDLRGLRAALDVRSLLAALHTYAQAHFCECFVSP